MEKMQDRNFTRMLHVALNKSWKQHPTKKPAFYHTNNSSKTNKAYTKIKKVGYQSRGWPEGSLFNSYNTEVWGKALLLPLNFSTLPFVVYWFIQCNFRYCGGIKDIMFLKHAGTERSRSVVRPTSDVTPTAWDL